MRTLTIVLIVLAAVILAGCTQAPQETGDGAQGSAGGAAAYDGGESVSDGSGTDGSGTQESEGAGSEASESVDDAEDGGTAEAAASGGADVLLFGRSVAYGWGEYMGLEWQEDETYYGEYGGNTIRYVQMDYPPDIDDSAERAMDTYDSDVVFFKLCFVDFGTEYGDMLEEDKEYVENVYQDAVVRRGRKLIVGNALPQVGMHSTPGLRQNHKAYDDWLDSFAASHDGVYVLDLNGLLSDSSGNLDSRYALSWDDSHLNSAGYARITPEFLDLVDEARG